MIYIVFWPQIVSAVIGLIFSAIGWFIVYCVLTSAYGGVYMAFNMPDESDLVSQAYKYEVTQEVTDYLYTLEEDRWKKLGFKIVKPASSDTTVAWINLIFSRSWEKKYKGEKVANQTRLYQPQVELYMKNHLSYKGNGVYHIKVTTATALYGVAKDGSYSQQFSYDNSYKDLENYYYVEVKVHPKRHWYGLVSLNPEILNYELTGCKPDEATVENVINSVRIPHTMEERKHEITEEEIKHEPAF